MDHMDQVTVLFAKEMVIISLLNQEKHIMLNVLTIVVASYSKRKELDPQRVNVNAPSLHI